MSDISTQRLRARYGSYDIAGMVGRDSCVTEYDAVAVTEAGSEAGSGAGVTVGLPVALKVLQADAVREQALVDDFLRDAERWLQLGDHGVRGLVDFGSHDDMLFVCCEPLVGVSAAELASYGRDATAPEGWNAYVAYILAEACRALEGAYHGSSQHGAPMIHGGISPHTLLIASNGFVYLDDFGFARAHARVRSKRSRDTARTLPYQAPEQLGRAHALTRQVDVWSLGVCMWEMLTGRSLFLGDSDAATLLALTVGALPAPSASNASVPPALDAIVQRCIARNPAERYATAAMMEADLRAFVASLPYAIGPGDVASLVRGPDAESGQLAPFSSAGRRLATATGFDIRQEPAPAPRRHSVAIGLLSALLAVVVLAGVWIWSARSDGTELPRYQASRTSLSVAGGSALAAEGAGDQVAAAGALADGDREASAEEPAALADADAVEADSDADAAGDEDADRDESARSSRRERRERRERRARSRSAESEREQQREQEAARAAAREREQREEEAGREQQRAETASRSAAQTAATEVPRASAITSPLPGRVTTPPAPSAPPTRSADATAAKSVKTAIAGLDVQGGVPRASIQRAIERVESSFQSCYLSASKTLGRSPSGAVSVHLVIDESNRASVTKLSGTPLSGMGSCLRQAAARIKSRTPPDVGRVRVGFQIRFSPSR